MPAFLPDKRNLADRPANNAGDGLTAENDAPQPARNTLADFLRILWVPFLGMLTCIFISNATEVPMEGYTLHSELIGAFVASIVAVIACFLVRKTPLTMAVEFIVTPSLIALAIVFGSFEPGSMPFYVGASLVFAPLMLMTLFALSLLESVIAARDFSMSFVAGVAVAATTLFTLFGAAVNLAVPSSIIAPHTWVIACIYFAIALVHICFVAWRNITRPATGALSEGSAADKNLDDPKQQAADVEAEWQARVDQLADTHGLTKRERELLGYMSRGYGSTYISKVLFISDNTVRTHIRNIYRKLGVHSREELIALFS